MNLSLFQKLAITLTFLFIFIAGVFYFWGKNLEQTTRFQSQQRLHLSLAPSLVRDNPLLQQGVYDYSALKNLFHTLMVLGPAFEFYLLDKTGKILTYSTDSSLIKRESISLTPIKNLIEYHHPLPVYGDDPKHQTRQKIFSATPIFNGANLIGYLYVIVASERYVDTFDEVQQSNKIEVSIVILSIGLFALFILMLWLFRNITSPIRQLNKEMTILTKQGFNPSNLELSTWKNHSKNDVHQLGYIFNKMVVHIQQQFEQLKGLDYQRKEMLAELSHDLRTPLASLHGYIETLALKEEQLSRTEKQAFLATALKNANVLKNLIDQIFELAHIESGHVKLVREELNLVELIYDVLAKFTLSAKDKKIDLIFAPQSHHIIVNSDINKLERVLTNLIENALRHTPEGGEVLVILRQETMESCEVSVKDSGVGIAQRDIEHIFDSRYQASNNIASKNQQNIGLGLAISQKLLAILNTELQVDSEVGKGSEFTFRLASLPR